MRSRCKRRNKEWGFSFNHDTSILQFFKFYQKKNAFNVVFPDKQTTKVSGENKLVFFAEVTSY